MSKYKVLFIVMLAAALVFAGQAGSVWAETWYLQQGRNWKAVSAEAGDKYLPAVAQTKKLVDEGQCKAAEKAFNQLKKDFPETAGPDLDAFIEAEMLRCKDKFVKAIRSYDKFLAEYYHESELCDAVLDRQFAVAAAFLAGRKKTVLGVFRMKGYAEGERIMERISDRAGLDTPMGTKAAVAVAKSREKRGKFDAAYYKWWEVFSQRKIGQIAKDALLGMARCRHAAFRGPEYDASRLIGRAFSEGGPYDGAKGCYEEFRVRYPKDAEKLGIDEKLKQIDEQLAEKQLVTAKYYQKTGSGQSANFYCRMVVDNWPQTKAAETASEMLVRNLGGKETEK